MSKQYEVANGDTQRGYWEWVAHQDEQSYDIEKGHGHGEE